MIIPALRLTLFGPIITGAPSVVVTCPRYLYTVDGIACGRGWEPSVYRASAWTWTIARDTPATVIDYGSGISAEVCRDVITLWPDELGAVAFGKLPPGSMIYSTFAAPSLPGLVPLGTGEYKSVCDFDLNGYVNADDYDAFTAAFVAGDPSADWDCSGYVNGDDIDLFVQYFQTLSLYPWPKEPATVPAEVSP